MKNPIPESMIAVFPDAAQKNPDAAWVALASKMDSIFGGVLTEVKLAERMHLAYQAPASVLDELGYMVGAGITQGDSDSQKRKKIWGAVPSQKSRGQWIASAKPIIDIITGYSASLFSGYDDFWPVRLGGDIAYGYDKWANRGSGAVAAYVGMVRTGDGDEPIVGGNVYIDLGNGAISAAVIQQVKDAIATDIVPAYYRVVLGYISSGSFVEYGRIP